MKRVFKYELKIIDDQVVELQGEPLSVVTQHGGDIMLYAWNDADAQKCKYDVHISGTGHLISHEIATNYKFIGTVVLYNGMLVFHVFARKREVSE